MSNSFANIIPANYTTAVYTAISLTSLFVAYKVLLSAPKPTPVLPASEMKTVVILGGSYAGLTTAHKLLKASATTGNIKVILISPNTHLYWNLASVRAIVPGQFADNQLFAPIAPGFKQYRADQFEFIIGTAESLDTTGKKVTISSSKTGTSSISYDILVLATGSHTRDEAPWKSRPTYEETLSALHDFQSRVKKATSIVVVGAGATGVETAGELGFEYSKSKKIILIASGDHVLEGTPASVAKTATGMLKNVNVELKLKTKVVGDAKMPDGRTELTLSSGEKLVTDLYLPTTGLVPNSSYLPSSLLNAQGFVNVSPTLAVKGVEDIWAAGDISAIQRPQLVNAQKQSELVAKNIFASTTGGKVIELKLGSDMMAVPVGRKAGTGHMGSFKLPSFMVVMVKGKKGGYFTDKLGKTVDGTA